MKRRVIHDCDPGTDDAIALALLLGHPENIDVLGITTVHGNAALPDTTQNALDLLKFFRRGDISVFAGCAAPMQLGTVAADGAHGPGGLGGLSLPRASASPSPEHAADFILQTLLESPANDISLLATGPLTNVATALNQQPSVVSRLGQLVVMGGCDKVLDAGGHLRHGNITPEAEFNFYVDPHAADVVLRARLPVTLLPLDVTHQVVSTRKRWSRFNQLPAPFGHAAITLLRAAEHLDCPKFAVHGAFLHDAVAAAFVLRPEAFVSEQIDARVIAEDNYRRGRLLVSPASGSDAIRFVRHVKDPDAIYDLVFNAMQHLAQN